MRRRAESVERQPAAGGEIAAPQCPIADDAGAQQRRGLDVAERLGQFVAERRRRDSVFGISAVGMVAGEAGRLAEVLLAAGAKAATAAGVTKPSHADALAEVDGRIGLRNRERLRGWRSRKRRAELCRRRRRSDARG